MIFLNEKTYFVIRKRRRGDSCEKEFLSLKQNKENWRNKIKSIFIAKTLQLNLDKYNVKSLPIRKVYPP